MTTGSAAGLIQDLYLTEVPTEISIGSTFRVGSGNVTDVEEVQVLNLFDGNVVRILRNTGIAHTLGSNVDFLNNLGMSYANIYKFKNFNKRIE